VLGLRPLFWVIVIAKLLVEVAALSLLGQMVLGWLIGPKRQDNLVYRTLQTVALPAHRLADVFSARWVLKQHRPWVALALLALAWCALTIGKIVHCLNAGVAQCLA
jgi:Tfp pilus assembly protein PilN